MNELQSIRDVCAGDLKYVAGMFAAAFQDDPVMSFIFPDPAVRAARLPDFFKAALRGDLSVGRGYITSGGEAATIWRPPSKVHMSNMEMVQGAWPWLKACRSALRRALAYSSASESFHPKELHWFLHIAGCSPSKQGRGFGGTALRAGLKRCDADGMPAYLDTCTELNVAMYERLGFVVTHEWAVDGGPLNWSMLRKAQR